ncbi:MAG: flagellar basal body L-ring protein FlgH [Armatimonadota bacterium]
MAVSSPITAESLWKPQETKSQLADKKAAKVGDIVTVVIVESSTSSQKASTDTKKDSSVEAGPGVGPLLDRVPLFSYGGGDSMSASGSTSRSSNFTAKMTATITKVNENGTMELEGTRFVQTNKEKEEIKLSGTIRPQDIATDNSILSTYVADAKITHVGSGPIGSRQKEGLIGKIFKILF